VSQLIPTTVRPKGKKGQVPSPSHFTTDSQSVCLSWCRAPSGANDQEGQVVPVLNYLSTMPRRFRGKWRCSCFILGLGTRWS
jgi:hypothetical protein